MTGAAAPSMKLGRERRIVAPAARIPTRRIPAEGSPGTPGPSGLRFPHAERTLLGPGSLATAVDRLLDTAVEVLALELPEATVLDLALAAARDSSWAPVDYLHAWREQIRDHSRLPVALQLWLAQETAR